MPRPLAWILASCLVACAAAPPPVAAPPAVTLPARPAAAESRCARIPGTASRLALVVLGSGGPASFGRAASSYLVLLDGVARILVDVGPGAYLRLGQLGVDVKQLDTILLTHLHIDHAGDLPGVVKSRDLSLAEPLTFRIFGPAGGGVYPSTTQLVERLFGERGAFAYLRGFKNRLELAATDLPTQPDAPIREVLRERDLRVTSIAVDHDDVPAVAFRIDYADHALVVSGDLASKNENLAKLAAGADLLVYDTTVLDPPSAPPVLYDLHTAPHRIGEVAAAARVKALLLSHIPPAVDSDQPAVLRSVKDTYRGPVTFAADCTRIDLAR